MILFFFFWEIESKGEGRRQQDERVLAGANIHTKVSGDSGKKIDQSIWGRRGEDLKVGNFYGLALFIYYEST